MKKNPLTLLLPCALVLAILLAGGLTVHRLSGQAGLRSVLIDTPVPPFQRPEFSSADLKGQVSLVNFFASWCPPCEAEHPELIRLKNDHGISIYGVNYKDSDIGRVDYLQRLGNPYAAVAPDPDGELAAQLMIQGVPETIVVDARGYIRYRLSAPLTPDLVEETILPLIRELKR